MIDLKIICYRELNRTTVNNKFPIPVLEEIIDELAASMVFTSLLFDQMMFIKQLLNLHRSLWVPNNIICLTNALVSFKGWMNEGFKPHSLETFLDIVRIMKTIGNIQDKSECGFLSDKVYFYVGNFIWGKGGGNWL